MRPPADLSALDAIGFTSFDVVTDNAVLKTEGTIAWLHPIEFNLPGLDSISVVALNEDGMTEVGFSHQRSPDFEFRLLNLNAALRVKSDLLRCVHQIGGKWVPKLDDEGMPMPVEFELSGPEVVVTADLDVSLEGTPTLTLPAMALGDTGIVLEVTAVNLYLNANDPSPPQPGFTGVAITSAFVHLTGGLADCGAPPKTKLTDVLIGSSGFGGHIEADWLGTSLEGAIFGMPCSLKTLSMDFCQNVPTGGGIKATITLPFFDGPVDIEIGFTSGGGLTVGIDSNDGLKTVFVPSSTNPVLKVVLDSLKFEVDAGVLTATMSGKLTPTVPGLTWPAIDLKDLKIDSKGNVKLPGGWLDLPKQYGLNFHGFKVEITKFGMGRNEDGTKWIGFSGGVKLVDGLPAGASVEGLRITADEHWTPSSAKISFNGVGVELEVKDVLSFKGDVAYREFEAADGVTIHRFDGDIKLNLHALKLEIDGALVVGSVEATNGNPAYNFFAIYIGVELPTGIPLGTTGVGLYGFDGLLAIQMEPDKHAGEPWYGVAPGEGWYKRDTVGVTDLKEKWRNEFGSKAFGAGVTLGTYADNGYTFNGKVLLAIVFPGPIILIEGKANLLKDRAQLGSGDPLFRALAVLDNRAGTFLVGLDAKYKYDKTDGKLINISGGAEAYYKLNDPTNGPTAWHIYLGEREPRERRIQANILSLFSANAYLMLDAHKLAMGAWIGYDRTWNYPPLTVTLQAWMEGNAIVSYKPAHLYGDLWAHGAVDLKALGFGTGLTIDARLAADVFNPFHVLGEFDVEFRLPWPLKKKHFEAHVKLEWGPEQVAPPLPVALKDVAIEHFKTSVKWPLPLPPSQPPPPLPLPTLLVPDYADGDGFLKVDQSGALLTTLSEADLAAGPPPDVPVVPLDCRPSISFGRNVNDDAKVGAIVQPPNPEFEQIGDPTRGKGPACVRYGLKEVRLEKWIPQTTPPLGYWKAVAVKGTNIPDVDELYGTWAPVPSGTAVGQNKLLLWSKCAFDHLRHTGTEWGEWFAGAFEEYPCIPDPLPSRVCLDFEDYEASGKQIGPRLTHPDHDGVHFQGAKSLVEPVGFEPYPEGRFTITQLPDAVAGQNKALCPTTERGVLISFDEPANHLRVAAVSAGSLPINLYVQDQTGADFGPFPLVNNVVQIDVSDVKKALLVAQGSNKKVCLLKVCADLSPDAADAALLAVIRRHNASSTARWSAKGDVLDPYTNYRLRVVTTIKMTGQFSAQHDNLPQLAYFQTKGPPGLVTGELDRPVNIPITSEFQSGLDDLSRYVRQTIPPTVPKTGEPPLLPRPVYRGYDVGVRFNEDYVNLMYRLAGRDLALVLYDRNNEPLRDPSGRLVVTDNPWGVAEELTFNAQETLWQEVVNGCACDPGIPPIDPDVIDIPHDQTLSAADARQILDPDALYDARLMPLLLHEDFGRIPAETSAEGAGQSVGRWQVSDLVGTGTPSHWEIEEFGPPAPPPRPHRVTQTSGIGISGTWLGGMPALSWLGTMLVLGNHPGLLDADSSQPPNWSDYRVSLYLRSSADGMIGLAFRYAAANTFYLFTMDRPNGAHRLLRIKPDGIAILAANENSYDLNRDYHLVIEAIGESLRVYLDETLIFDVTDDAALEGGGLALQCSSTNGAAFSDIQVHDFSKTAKSVYHFPFTTSEFVDFFHHMHSFDDESWLATCTLPDAELASLCARAIDNPTDPTTVGITDEEARAFEALADSVLGPSARQLATRTEFTRINYSSGVDESDDVEGVAVLLRMSEPIDWTRVSLSLSQTAQSVPTALAPMTAKLVAATLGSQEAVDERITLLIRESTNLTGHRIEKREVATGSVLPLDGTDETAPAWVPIYEFGSEDTLPAGTRVIVVSGPPDDPATAEPRTVKRLRAQPGDDGVVQFSSDPVDLRLVAPQGNVFHARRFLDSTAMVGPVGVRLLRKADGTACFILPASPDTSFPQGPFQMTMEFKRDNKSLYPESLVLSAAGQTTPETAILDIPWATL